MKKSVILGITTTLLLSSVSFASFIDVSESDWYYSAIDYVSRVKLLNGVEDGIFEPNSNMTRAMATQVLYNMEDNVSTADQKSIYDDVEEDKWYKDSIMWASNLGIVEGTGDNKFSPSSNVTKEQMITILYNYAKFKEYDMSVGEDTNILSYNDFLNISEYAYEPIQWACGCGIVTGDDEGNLLPEKELTRAEVASIISNFNKYYGKKAWIELDGELENGYVWSVINYKKAIIDVSDYEYIPAADENSVGKFKFEIFPISEGNSELIFKYSKSIDGGAEKIVICEVGVDNNKDIQLIKKGSEDVKNFIVEAHIDDKNIPDFDSRIIGSVEELKKYKDEVYMNDFIFEFIANSVSKYDESFFSNSRLAVILKKDATSEYDIMSVDRIEDNKLTVTVKKTARDEELPSVWYIFVELPAENYSNIDSVNII